MNRNTIRFLLSIVPFAFCTALATHPANAFAAVGASSTGRKPALQKSGSFSSATVRVEPGVLFVKFRPQAMLGKAGFKRGPRLEQVFSTYGVYRVEATFPFIQSIGNPFAPELQRVFTLHFDASKDPLELARELRLDPSVEYAEPNYLYTLQIVPNDSLYVQQGQFNAVNLPQAWDLVKGEDGNVVVAIVDGGTDWRHPDLEANVWVNEDEVPGNGIDDDNNGFVDDVHGWNFANGSGDPSGLPDQTLNPQHGTHVAGIACAVSDNRIGVAGASWNAKFMPINAASARADTSIGFGYQGIVYAAENGADIINCSWGGKHSPSKLQQEVINFAYAQGSLVVAAAGNDGTSNDTGPHFPSNYNHVLAVGSISNFGRKSGFSNYGINVDVFAPGEAILSTLPDNQYGRISGTSMASPLVAGIAALLKTKHPNWNVDQLREQLRVSAKNIDNLNPNFTGKMGRGKVQAYEALTVSGLPAIRVVSSSFQDSNGNGQIEPQESIRMQVKLTNFLATATNVVLTLGTDDITVTIDSTVSVVPSFATGDTLAFPFTFHVRRNLREGEILSFYVNIQADNYEDRDVVDLIANPPQVVNHDTGVLQTSITAQGNIGFTGFAQESPGVGFVFRNRNYLFEGGLMLGTGVATVSDCIRGADGSTQDDDFRPISLVTLVEPGNLADQEGEVVLVDSFATNPLGVEIAQTSYAYSTDPFNGFVIFKYIIKNLNTTPISNLWTGLFFDWDINTDANDYARFDPRRNLGWVQDTKTNPKNLAGTRVLSAPGAASYRSISNPDDIYGGQGRDGFTDQEKWQFLSGGIQRTVVDSNDVSSLASTGPFTINPGETIEVAFAVIGGNSQDEFIRNAELAQFLWDNNLIPILNQKAAATSTQIFQNPAATQYADVVVIADRALKGPPVVDIWQNADTTRVTMTRIVQEAEAYRGAFEFQAAGTYTIRTRSTNLINDVDSTQTRTFEVQIAKPGVQTQLTSTDGRARLFIPADAVSDTLFIMADVLELTDGRVYRFGPTREFERPLRIELNLDEAGITDPRHVFIQKRVGGRWTTLTTRLRADRQSAFAQITHPGDFRLAVIDSLQNVLALPERFVLRQNYPNPFNPETVIEYELPRSTHVTVTVFNALGQVIRVLYDGEQEAGIHRLRWDARDDRGRRVATGLYLYQLKTPEFSKVRKMIFMQ
ncbi:MAG: S8 family serine peptidase [candidate division KSB1 bacterium]|nr:S8 family serine peptidase [candidate division KSB1 bacterium]